MTIAVYGASGFTGRLVLAELHHRGIDAMPVGRSTERLQQAATQVGLAQAAPRRAGIDESEALVAALRDCRVVINCIAPFTWWGEPVLRAALEAGVHYLDTSGEQAYIKRVFDTYAEPAELAGVTVIPMVNDGGFLADLLTAATARGVQDVDDITVAHRTSGESALSRGSARSALANLESFINGGLIYAGRQWRNGSRPTRHSLVTFPGDVEPSSMARFPMPEIVTVPRHTHARRVEGLGESNVLDQLASVTPELVDALPEEPAMDRRSGTRFTITSDVRSRRRTTRGWVQGSDTYQTTASIAGEAALRLSLSAPASGVLAPAQAFDPAEFLDCLAPYGVRWVAQSVESS